MQNEPLVTLANWQEPTQLGWAFQNMREIIPTRLIKAPAVPAVLPHEQRDLFVPGLDELLTRTYTDGFLVMHDGAIVSERYFGALKPATRHLMMSVTKSVVGCVAGVLADRGLLIPEKMITDYVPEIADAGYAGASVRDLLDMRTGVAYRETYTDADAEVRVMERSNGWAPRGDDDPVGLYNYLATVQGESSHGGEFVYRSADTNMLGWVLERASGVNMADLVGDVIWAPLGAEFDADITVDVHGAPVHDGGMSAALRDLARFGDMVRCDGSAHGRTVVPEAWLRDTYEAPADVRSAFAATDNESVLPGGWYRNQFWFYRRADGTPIQLCLGIHGQLIYIDRAADLVIVKMSSWPDAQNVTFLVDTLRACAAIADEFRAGPGTR